MGAGRRAPRMAHPTLLLLHQGRYEAALVCRLVGHWVDHEVPLKKSTAGWGQAEEGGPGPCRCPQPRASSCRHMYRDRSSRPQAGPSAAAAAGHLLGIRQPHAVSVIRSSTVRLEGSSERAQALAPPRRPTPPTRRLRPRPPTSSQGRPSCPETGPARPGCAGAYKYAGHQVVAHMGKVIVPLQEKTVPTVFRMSWGRRPASKQQIHPPCPPLPPSPSERPPQARKGKGRARAGLQAAGATCPGTPGSFSRGCGSSRAMPYPPPDPQRRRSCTFTFSTEVVPTPRASPLDSLARALGSHRQG